MAEDTTDRNQSSVKIWKNLCRFNFSPHLRLVHVKIGLPLVAVQEARVRQSPNLGVRIFLYVAGILLVLMALVLLLQSFGLLTDIPKSAIYALVLLAIGMGILTALRNR